MLLDIYVGTLERDRSLVDQFIDVYAQEMYEAAESYEYPYLGDLPASQLNLQQLLDKVMSSESDAYTVYWTSKSNDAEIRNAILSFLLDGSVIFGLSLFDGGNGKKEKHLCQLAGLLNAKFGYVTVEEPPSETFAEFVKLAGRAERPALVGGQILS